MNYRLPRVALICHEQDRLVTAGLAAWLASSFRLVGIVRLREPPRALWQRILRELRRVGWLRFLDVLAFRLYQALFLARADAAWDRRELARVRGVYPARLAGVPDLAAADPNAPAVRDFLREARPDFVIACCKVLLARETFAIPECGTFALHPGICPEYRNAHGCFWALASRDLSRVGMTLLRVDEGIDTGPVFLQASYRFDELRESPHVIQRRVVFENLEQIAARLRDVFRGLPQPLIVTGRRSAIWGQPRLSAYVRWKSAARREAQRPGVRLSWR